MPQHPSEETTYESITEKIAANPSSNTESTASDHPIHDTQHEEKEEPMKASANDHHANPGPVRVLDASAFEQKGSREERGEEARGMNQK